MDSFSEPLLVALKLNRLMMSVELVPFLTLRDITFFRKVSKTTADFVKHAILDQ
jgi:hypothetical protein